MLRRNQELFYALAAIVVVTALYAAAYVQAGAFPHASGLVGHGIGILGFVLMLATETLYTLRKRRANASWGATSTWLRAHVFTGLVGPWMVVLHTAMRFRGIAGISMLLTGVVVASGAVGRYLYTSLPRDFGGTRKTQGGRSAVATWYAFHVPLTWVLFALAFVHAIGALAFATLQR